MNMNDRAIRVGQTYAQATFELAGQSNLVDSIKLDFDLLASLIEQNKEFETLMVSPSFHEEQKKAMISETFSGRVNELTENLLMVVTEHNRMRFLPQIIAKYAELWEGFHGLHRVKVTVSKEIDRAEVERITASISDAIQGQVKLEVAVNPAIIGGIIIRHGNRVIDNTIRNKLLLTVKEATKQRGLNGV
jgi:F-type H+-transporting ATPase subunit delta